MRALVQRVSAASVSADSEVLGSIGAGLVVLLGVGHPDEDAQAERLAGKVSQLRVFDGEHGRMDRSLLDVGGAVLCVSQFTLYGDTRRGLRPSFTGAAEPAAAERLYELFCARLRGRGVPVETGRFAARMSLTLTNEGPVTLLLEA
ncbi:MAG: D-aminoacyl-tRNA deacylase [Solirubrobacterales bacterium]